MPASIKGAQKKFTKAAPGGGRIGCVCCNARFNKGNIPLNQQITGGDTGSGNIWPQDTVDEAKKAAENESKYKWGTNDELVKDVYARELTAAKILTTAMCGSDSGNCCSEVEIWVFGCGNAGTSWVKEHLNNNKELPNHNGVLVETKKCESFDCKGSGGTLK